MNDLYISEANGHFSVFVLPDLAKSDTVDHSTVLEASSALGFQETTMATYTLVVPSVSYAGFSSPQEQNDQRLSIPATFLFSALGDLTQSNGLRDNQ